MIMATRVQFPDEALCPSCNTNTLGKGMRPPVVPLGMGK